MSHGHMITAVGGNGGYSGGKQFVTAEELREKLSHLRHEKALIVKLVSISIIHRYYEVGNNSESPYFLIRCSFVIILVLYFFGLSEI